ncbi:MAG: hypothetical protein KKA67_02735 [Spirochaetes bacterium]|nr:hypothetical protein [Spirochaetota bacterium]
MKQISEGCIIGEDEPGLVGRSEDLDRVGKAFRRSRLVTIVGDGGIGKTSLAKAFAKLAGGRASRLVCLADADAPGEVPGLVATALGAKSPPGVETVEAIALSLSDKDRGSLVILDNFEHLLYASRFVERLRELCPSLSLLVTSRVPLGLRAEHIITLSGLSLRPVASGGESPALRLMIESVRKASPGFEPSGTDAAALLELCRRLEGNPLSIELAAARIAMHPELARSSPETLLDFVAQPRKGARGRHASLEETIDWSYRLLPAPPRILLAELGAFAGSVSMASAEALSSLGREFAVAAETLERARFIQIKMSGTEPYVSSPEPTREFMTRLLARATFRERALDARTTLYAGLAAAADAELGSGASGPACRRLVRELPSLKASVRRMIENRRHLEAAEVVLSSYRPIHAEGSFSDGLYMLEACLAAEESLGRDVVARLSWKKSGFLFRLGRFAEAAEAIESALVYAESLDDRGFSANLQASLAVVRLELGDFDRASEAFSVAEAWARERGDERLKMRLAINRGLSADLRGEYESAGTYYAEAAGLARRLDDAPSLGLVMKNAAARLFRLERYEESVVAYLEALTTIGITGVAYAQAAARIGLGYALTRLGRPAEARRELDEAFALSRAAGIDDSPTPETCLAYAELAEAESDLASARGLVAEALRTSVRSGELRLLAPSLEAAARQLALPLYALDASSRRNALRALSLASDLRARLRLPAPAWDARRIATIASAIGRSRRASAPSRSEVSGEAFSLYARSLEIAEALGRPARELG